MNADAITGLFGLPVDDARIGAVLKALGDLPAPVMPPWDAFSFHDWVLADSEGIELGFADKAWQAGAPMYQWGDGPLVLTEVYFYAGLDDEAGYAGVLPHGLAWTDTREQARAKLVSAQASWRGYRDDTWDVPGYRLNVAYDDDGLTIERVACLALPAEIGRSTAVTPPALNTITAALGSSLRGDAVTALWPHGWDDEALAMADEDGELDLTDSYGVTAGYAGGRGKRRLRSVALHANRDADSAGWAGELPAGLSFDDSPDTLLRKMGDPPAHQADDDTQGLAVWHRPEASVQVRYSHVHNRLVRISLIAPGAWKAAIDGEDFEQD